MEKLKIIEALNVAGSIASVTGISLLAIGSITTEIQMATISAYLMSASIFIGVLALFVYGYLKLYPLIAMRFGAVVAIAVSAVLIPLIIWLLFYFILLLKALAIEEFLWLIGQVSK